MNNKRLLLTPGALGKIRAKIPGTSNVIVFARQVSDRTAKAQLAYCKPLIEKAERERIWQTMRNLATPNFLQPHTIESAIKNLEQALKDS